MFKVKAVFAISNSHRATLTSAFDFQHKVSYERAIINTRLKCTFCPMPYGHGTDTRTDGQTDGSQHCLMLSILFRRRDIMTITTMFFSFYSMNCGLK